MHERMGYKQQNPEGDKLAWLKLDVRREDDGFNLRLCGLGQLTYLTSLSICYLI
jgi:hypothetical protein